MIARRWWAALTLLPGALLSDALLPDAWALAETQLPAVTVNATRAQGLPGGAALLEEQLMHNTAQVHVAELTARLPGVWISRGGGQEHLTALRSPVWSGPGACGEFVFAEDGVPVRPSGFCNANQFIEINSEQSGGMEMLPGSQGGALYGSNAVHGVFNVLSLPLQQRHSVSVEGGPNDYARSLWQHGDEDGFLAVNATHDGGYVDSSGYDQQKLAWKQQQQFGGIALTHLLSTVHLDQQSAGYLIGDEAYRDDARRRDNASPDAYRDVDALRYVQSWQWQQADYHHSFKPYLRHSAMDFSQHFLFPASLEENGHNSGGAMWQMTRDNFSWGTWRSGADVDIARAWLQEWQEKNGTAQSPLGDHYDYAVDMATAGAWQEIDWQLSDSLQAQFGLRADRVLYDYDNRMAAGSSGKFTRPDDRSDGFTLLSPRAGLVYTDVFDNEWYASLARGNRAPQAAELYRLQRSQRVADIGEVQADGGEIGWRGSRMFGDSLTTRWQLTLFDMQKDHVIIRNVADVFDDNAKTRHRGVEINGRSEWQNGWFVALAATYAEHRYDSDVFDKSSSVHGNIIDTAPRTLGSVQAGWQARGLLLEAEWQHMGDYYLNPESTFAYEGHDLLHLRASTALAPDWRLFACLMNATGRDYAERADVTVNNNPALVQPRYFVGLPRSLFVGIEWSY